jgi:hypothetical protein
MAGYMFVGLGEEIHKFVEPEVHELFVGVARTNYRLMGRYRAHRVEPLTVEEWMTLPEKVSILNLKDILLITHPLILAHRFDPSTAKPHSEKPKTHVLSRA